MGGSKLALVCLGIALSWGCHVGGATGDGDIDGDGPHVGDRNVLLADPSQPDPDSGYEYGMTVDEAAVSGCSTSVVSGLAQQLIEQIECMRPGSMVDIRDIAGVNISTFPYLQRAASEGLQDALADGGSITINSALRSTVQQYVLYKWYIDGLCTNVVALAAKPGHSNHESGLALDVGDYSSWRSRLEAVSFDWFGSNDPVHFDYVGGGTDMRNISVEAFQRLWNHNNPDTQISVDGLYGPQTAGAIGAAPADGFEFGPDC